MEGKALRSVILVLGVLLVMGSSVALPQAAAASSKICCKDENAKKCFYVCLFKGSRVGCAATCHCVLTSGTTCPGDYPATSSNLLANKEDLATEYCKLGCRSSVCGTMGNVDGSEEMRAAVERCGDACGRLCDGNASSGAGGIASVAA